MHIPEIVRDAGLSLPTLHLETVPLTVPSGLRSLFVPASSSFYLPGLTEPADTLWQPNESFPSTLSSAALLYLAGQAIQLDYTLSILDTSVQ